MVSVRRKTVAQPLGRQVHLEVNECDICVFFYFSLKVLKKASGCESEPDEVRCCTAGTPMMSTVQGVGPCSYKGVNGQCTDSCPSGYSTKKYSQGALGCKSFAADVLCCVPTASLLYDAGDDTTGDPNGEQPASSSMTLSSGDNINIVVGVVLAAIIVIGVAVAVVIFLVVRRRQQNLSM